MSCVLRYIFQGIFYMQNILILLIITRNWKVLTRNWDQTRTDQKNWESFMIEKLRFLKYEKFIPDKSFPRITFSRSNGDPREILKVWRGSGGPVGSWRWKRFQGSRESRGSWGSVTVFHFFNMPDQSRRIKKHLSEISKNRSEINKNDNFVGLDIPPPITHSINYI